MTSEHVLTTLSAILGQNILATVSLEDLPGSLAVTAALILATIGWSLQGGRKRRRATSLDTRLD